MTDEVMDSDKFFHLVDELLAPSMAALGYHRIGGSENDQPRSRGPLASPGIRVREGASPKRTGFLLYDFGFEAGSDDAQRMVDATDPDSAEELWLFYEPAARELDLSAWAEIAKAGVDWDLRADSGPCDEPEVRRRLLELGNAVADFARAHGGSPPTP